MIPFKPFPDFTSPRAINTWAIALEAEIQACPAAERAIIIEHSAAAFVALRDANRVWNRRLNDRLAGIRADYAARRYGEAVYVDAPNPWNHGLRWDTWEQHRAREGKKRAFMLDQIRYRLALEAAAKSAANAEVAS